MGKAEIHLEVREKGDWVEKLFGFEYDYERGEPLSYYHPGCPESVEITAMSLNGEDINISVVAELTETTVKSLKNRMEEIALNKERG